MTNRKPRTLADIVAHPAVESTHVEDDGCFTDSLGREIPGRWVYLKRGWISPDMECGTIHEPSIKACCELLANVRRVTRDECAAGYVTDLTVEEFDAINTQGE